MFKRIGANIKEVKTSHCYFYLCSFVGEHEHKQAQSIVGKADVEAINIYAGSYEQNPEF
ncbi:MAG: hypothetical protein L6308_01380 [Candidatus Omnitrophica bacterium]|nr:hypothetical protein [Candidatus Omnitrophota bacterium]